MFTRVLSMVAYHDRIILIDRGRNFGAVLMLVFHSLGEPGVGCARRSFKPCPFDRETRFERIETLLLIGGESELVMHEIVQSRAGFVIGPAICGKSAEAPGERCQQHRENNMRRLQILLLHVEER